MSRKIRKQASVTLSRRLVPLVQLARRGGYASVSLFSFWSLLPSSSPLLSPKIRVSDPHVVRYARAYRFSQNKCPGVKLVAGSHPYTSTRARAIPSCFSIHLPSHRHERVSAFLSRYFSPSLFMCFYGFRVCLSYTHLSTSPARRRKASRRSNLPKVEFIRERKRITSSDSEIDTTGPYGYVRCAT